MKRVNKIELALDIALYVAVATVALAIGFLIGKSTASDEKAPPPTIETSESIDETQVVLVEAPPEPTDEVTTTPYTTAEIYYDCPLSEELQDYIRRLCQENKLPMSLVIAMIDVESDFRPDLISQTNDYGLMQINKCNHEWLANDYGITDFLDPYQNVFCGITIISEHYHRYEDLDKALMAYNLGATGAKRLQNKGIYTTEYTRKVTTAMEVYNA